MNESFRHEVSKTMAYVVAGALMAAFLLGGIVSIRTEYAKTQSQFAVVAKILALSSQSALLFSDVDAASETLESLVSNPSISRAWIVSDHGTQLAFRSYSSDAENNNSKLNQRFLHLIQLLPEAWRTENIRQSVSISGKLLGHVGVRMTLDDYYLLIFKQLVMWLGVMLVSFVVSFHFLSRLVEQAIAPILNLAASARAIAGEKNYTLRVAVERDDEVGELTRCFNDMLGEIEKRDSDLVDRNGMLEDRVRERTARITATLDEMRALLHSVAEGVVGLDTGGRCRYVNDAFVDLFGFVSRRQVIGRRYADVMPCRCGTDCALGEFLDNTYQTHRASHIAELQLEGVQGLVEVECWIEPVFVSDKFDGVVLTMIDISERKRAEAELRIAACAFETREGIMITDARRRIVRVNRAFSQITGYSEDEVRGRTPGMLRSGRHNKEFYRAMWQQLSVQDGWQGEIWNRRKDGSIYPELLSITAVKNALGNITNYVGIFADISQLKNAENEVRKLAYFDTLTELPNRRNLLDRLAVAIESCSRYRRGLALLFVDLDNFKLLNDSMGHDYGDLLLKEASARMSVAIRSVDMVSRFGGDEFVVLLEDLDPDPEHAALQAESVAIKIKNAIDAPFVLGDKEYQLTASTGVALLGDPHTTADELLKQADIAMYYAKRDGRDLLRFFDPAMQVRVSQRAALESDLRHALAARQFEVFCQAQVDDNGTIYGAEVLLRWKHPQRGYVPPLEFIPLAEDNGLIVPIGEWVIDSALEQLAEWGRQPTTQLLTLSVNISARQFRDPDFVARVERALERYPDAASRLKFEITESILAHDLEDVARKIDQLRVLGIQLSLDDFGTGYSSLQYLKKLPIFQLKIDQSFVHEIETDPNDVAIIETIVAMARTMNFEVIAEGVESQRQMELLLDCGCYLFQGYLFGRPEPLSGFGRALHVD